MRYLVATDSVHTTAAACDYLEPRLEDDDFVSVVSVPGTDERDAEDALNVVNARLAGLADITTEHIEFLRNSLERCRHRAANRRHDTAGVWERSLFSLPHQRLYERINFSLAVGVRDGHLRTCPRGGG